MALRVSASSVKSWFQYRCERKFVYECMDPSELKAVPVTERPLPAPWAEFGDDYEEDVLAAYRQQPGVSVLGPAPAQDFLSDEASLAFIRGDLKQSAAYQLALKGSASLRAHLHLDDVAVEFKRGFVDLVLAREED